MILFQNFITISLTTVMLSLRSCRNSTKKEISQPFFPYQAVRWWKGNFCTKSTCVQDTFLMTKLPCNFFYMGPPNLIFFGLDEKEQNVLEQPQRKTQLVKFGVVRTWWVGCVSLGLCQSRCDERRGMTIHHHQSSDHFLLLYKVNLWPSLTLTNRN